MPSAELSSWRLPCWRVGAVIIFAWPTFWPVAIANSLMAVVGDVFGPAVAALTLGLYARNNWPDAWGGTRPSTMPATSPSPWWLARSAMPSRSAPFSFSCRSSPYLASLAVLSIPADAIDYDRARDLETEPRCGERAAGAAGYGVLFKSRPLVIFGLCAMLFHFANAPLLPLVGQKLAAAYPKEATAMMSACIVAAQLVMRVLKLIRAFLNAGVMEDGLVRPVDEGTPQGGPLSPILSNLVLDDLDKELARRGHRFCRYADDCNIYVRSHRAGERVMASVSRFLTNRLRLKVNEAKSAVARPEERKFLGFSISNDGSERRIAPKALDKFKGRIRDITRRTRGFSLQQLIKELKPYIVGWRGYFGFCQTPRVLTNLEAWIRRRLRLYLWRQWRTRQNRFAELRRRGVAKFAAAVAAGSPTGLWRMSGHPAVQQALRNAYFESLGLPQICAPAQA